ncbi:MAG: tetratricopeptide repeat protein [candidate division Zixibacteria bacterium]|nr:tetratricopeptide repeat protein [candidate division Zixibacteria bacterium]
MRFFISLALLSLTVVCGFSVSVHAQSDAAAERLETGRVLFQRASYDSARVEIEAALALRKRFPEAHLWKGRIALATGELAIAEKAFRAAIGQREKYADAYCGLGDVMRRRKNRKLDAIEKYQEALRIDPVHAEACYNLGSVYRELTFDNLAPFGVFRPFYLSKGLEALKKTLELDPTHPQANHDLGYIYEVGMNDIEQAMPYYERQLEANPLHGESLARLGQWYFKTGKLSEGVGTFNRLIRKHPKIQEKVQPTLTMLEATLHLENRAYDRAQGAFEQFISTLPEKEKALYDDILFVAPDEDVRRYTELSKDRQAEYRRQFWKQRDADPTTVANERLIEHYRRVLFGRTNFGEKKFPWDRRGELYIRYGEPDDRQRFTFGIGNRKPIKGRTVLHPFLRCRRCPMRSA